MPLEAVTKRVSWRCVIPPAPIPPLAAAIERGATQRRAQPKLNPIMIFAWNQILPTAIERLPPIQRELVRYVMLQPGQRRPSYAYASERWGLAKRELDVALQEAYGSLRQYLGQYGLEGAGDLDFR